LNSPGVWLLAAALAPLLGLALLLWRQFSLEAPQVPLAEVPPSCPGLCFLSHRAHRRFPFQHLFIRITPQDPAWPARRPDLFSRRDAAGRPYCTLGAGPKDGNLFLEFNRGFDLRDPASFTEAIPCRDLAEENARIASLLASHAAYGQALPFAACSRVSGPGYNCNSMMRSLADRAGVPTPAFARHMLLCPGTGRPLPPTAFS